MGPPNAQKCPPRCRIHGSSFLPQGGGDHARFDVIVDRRQNLSPDEFFTKYASKGVVGPRNECSARPPLVYPIGRDPCPRYEIRVSHAPRLAGNEMT